MKSFNRVGSLLFSVPPLQGVADDMGAEEVTQHIVSKLTEDLEEEGFSLSDAFYNHFLLKDMGTFASSNRIYQDAFRLISPPSRACVETAQASKAYLDCMVFKGKRDVLHVQSISKWAPCCIGPYSQASNVLGLLFLAGQIGLIPEKMILGENKQEQIRLSFQNCERVLHVLQSDFSSCVCAIVFVAQAHNNPETIEMVTQELKERVLEKQASTPCIVMSVPRLPKDAVVEVQLVTYAKGLKQRVGDVDYSENEAKISQELSIYNTTAAIKGCYFSSVSAVVATTHNTQHTTAANANVDENGEAMQEAHIKLSIKEVFETANNSGLGRDKLFSLRVYFDRRLCHQSFINAYKKAMAGLLDTNQIPCISFIPVSALSLPIAVQSAPNLVPLWTCAVQFWDEEEMQKDRSGYMCY